MSFKKVVVLGGGPLGLMAAIEARQNFVRDVTLVEKRGGYSRRNVPVLGRPMISHLQKIQAAPAIWGSSEPGSSVAFSRIEEGLLQRAVAAGVKVEQGWIAEGLIGRDPNKHGRYKSIALTLRQCDAAGNSLGSGGSFKSIDADFLVVAVGAGAAANPLITNKLAFNFQKLAPVNYGTYGIFEAEPRGFTNPDRSQARQLTRAIAGNPVALGTPDHNYLLATLRNCSPADIAKLRAQPGDLKKVLLTLGQSTGVVVLENLKEVEKNVALFEVSIQRAQNFYSQMYPAVLLGDAAVTPHPEQASGTAAGFSGFEQLQKLFQELKKLNRSDNIEAQFNSFNSGMELIVAKKALEGTRAILANNIETIRNYIARLQREQPTLITPEARALYTDLIQRLEPLQKDFETQNDYAKQLLEVLDKGGLQSRGAVSELWALVKQSHNEIQSIMGHADLMSENLAKIRSRFPA